MKRRLQRVIQDSFLVALLGRIFNALFCTAVRASGQAGSRMRQVLHFINTLSPVRAFGIVLLSALLTEWLVRLVLQRPADGAAWRLALAGLSLWAIRAAGLWGDVARGSFIRKLLSRHRGC